MISLLQILLLAFGLSMDAFAVALAEGTALREGSRAHGLRVGICFGGFQAVMPVLGWLAGASALSLIGAFDHWVAFGLLFLVGAHMMIESATAHPDRSARGPSGAGRLCVLGLATSIDALAAGVSLAMLHASVWAPAVLIGLVTGLLSLAGVHMGDRLARRLGPWAERAGALMLWAIGTKVLLDHLSA